MVIPTRASPDLIDGVYYPSEEDMPMAETGIHAQAMIRLFQLLRRVFGRREDVYVAVNMFWYWERGNPAACSSPDVMVNLGVRGNHERRSFRTWLEGGVVPAVTFEMASENTWRTHLNENRPEYERLGVREFFMFDPEDLYLPQQLLGFRLEDGRYVPLTADETGAMLSQELNLLLIPDGAFLRLADPATRRFIPTDAEEVEEKERRADEESRRANAERQRADEERRRAEEQQRRAEEQTRRAEEERRHAEEARRRAEEARQREEEERHRAEEQQRQAEEQQRRADALQAEIERLQALLLQKRGGDGPGPETPLP
jgi:Uma2 family endonuclease